MHISAYLIHSLPTWPAWLSGFWVKGQSVSSKPKPLQSIMFLYAFLHCTISKVRALTIRSALLIPESEGHTERQCPQCILTAGAQSKSITVNTDPKSKAAISQLLFLKNIIISIHGYVQFCINFIASLVIFKIFQMVSFL